MKLVTKTGSTSYTDIQVMQDVQKLYFKITFDNAHITDPRLTMNIKKGGADSLICNKVKLSKLFEFAQTKEGFINRTVSPSVTRVEGYVDVADFGAISLNDKKYLSLELTDLHATATVEIFAKNSSAIAEHYFEYNVNNTPVGQETINVMTLGKEYFLVDVQNLLEVKLQYASGRNERLTAEECAMDANDNNDLVSVETTLPSGTQLVKYGFDQLFQFKLTDQSGQDNVVSVELTTNGTSLQYFVVDSIQL